MKFARLFKYHLISSTCQVADLYFQMKGSFNSDVIIIVHHWKVRISGSFEDQYILVVIDNNRYEIRITHNSLCAKVLVNKQLYIKNICK